MARVNDDGDVVLNTGKKIFTIYGRITIDCVYMNIINGYSSYITEQDNLTLEERRELADYYINLWNKWAISKPGGR